MKLRGGVKNNTVHFGPSKVNATAEATLVATIYNVFFLSASLTLDSDMRILGGTLL